MKRGRKYRKIEIERILGKYAWTGQELAQALNISPLNARRYLRRYFHSGRLTRKKFGSTWYYAIARFLKSPNFIYSCPRCKGKMGVYKKSCGCEFQICERHKDHSIWKYCSIHIGTIPRYGVVEATCAVCGKKEKVKIDRKEKTVSGGWRYYGRLSIPGVVEKIEYWECEGCGKETSIKEYVQNTPPL